MPIVDVRVYYLQMFAAPEAAPPEGLSVVHARTPTVPYYRFLYNEVGRAYHWRSRGQLSDAELAAAIGDPRNELYVLHVDGTPAGFAELDRRQADDVELVQFGLMPPFIGRGLGARFLAWTIHRAWQSGPRRFWLHTCTLDHPRALPNYLAAGFRIFREELIQRELAC
jgi:GNAT superfamily N-acetyltransferase